MGLKMTTQRELDERSSAALDAIARETGKTPDQLVHEAVEELIQRRQPADRLSLLRQARGMWQDREDLPDLTAIRGEMDRF
jgi:predicted transcriptional regulator